MLVKLPVFFRISFVAIYPYKLDLDIFYYKGLYGWEL